MYEELYALPHPGHPKIAKKLFKVPVKIVVSDSRLCETIKKKVIWLIAKSPVDAANWVRDQLDFLPETEITAYGPNGGETHRFIGWESAIGAEIAFHPTDEEKLDRINLIFGDD